jgi:hypothetical protein
VLHIGQTEVVTEDEEVGEMEDAWVEWQEGVLRAERPAESAMCRRGTEGRARRLLCVCMKRFARVVQRV